MSNVFDMQEQIQGYIKEVEKQDAATLSKPIGSDPKTGPDEVAALLTFLPEEKRLAALKGFVMAMLCD